jgi:mRNA-degrading endonuclease RelE of RelBE toxin-antitoxin system
MGVKSSLGMIRSVQTSKRALKSLEKAPKQAVAKYMLWRAQVIENGLAKIQQIPGYNDEVLRGKLKGIRSIRLTDGYRAYYRIILDEVHCAYVEEVNKHDYKAIERLFGG